MSYTVLIVEDETILARNLARSLTRLRIDVVQAHTYTDAVAELSQRHFDLLCLDIQLGDGNGLDLAEAMQLVSAPVPVIIMTGQDTVPHRARAEHLNVVAFLGKPFALAQFRELVSSLLLDHKRDDELERSQREGPCVLMYSHDTIGLGHMRRNTAIAAALVQRVPGISVLLVVGCPAGVVFDVPKGVDVLSGSDGANPGWTHSLHLTTTQCSSTVTRPSTQAPASTVSMRWTTYDMSTLAMWSQSDTQMQTTLSLGPLIERMFW